MLHARMSALGWVVGGADAIVLSILDAVGPTGTIAAVVSWDDIPLRFAEWPQEWRDAYEMDLPPFDPVRSAANHEYGRVAERIRTWPGARRGAHPDQGVAAVGPAAEWLVHPHPLDDSFGAATPFSRLVEVNGDVLMLGAPLSKLTLVHHAEATAQLPERRTVRYRLPITENGRRVWREIHDIDTFFEQPVPYESVLGPNCNGIASIARSALEAGIGRSGCVAGTTCHLFPARDIVAFATRWLEQRFGVRRRGAAHAR